MKALSIGLITLYQRHISPHKGFRCAHAALHGEQGCSQAVKGIIAEQGLFGGWSDIRQRFRHCSEAYETLEKHRERRKKKSDSCDIDPCTVVDCIPWSRFRGGSGGGADGCDGPCDCNPF